MKKILSFAFLLVALLSTNVYSQSNLTWNVLEKIDENYFKRLTVFNIEVSGLNTEKEAASFCNTIRSNEEVKTCENLGKNKNNSYTVILKMNKPLPANYYIKLAENSGVTNIIVNGEKKTTLEWANGEKK